MNALEFRDVSVRYGSGRNAFTAVDSVSLEVPKGHIVGLVGESGSGKSTLAAAAVGLTPVAAGQILLDGVDVAHARGALAHRRRRIQLVFQDPYSSLNPRRTVGASIAEAIPRQGSRSKVNHLLQLVGLDADLAEKLPSTLSGGERQRVALARAMAADPHVIIADEITSSLDVSVQGAVLNLIRDLRGTLDMTILFVSHNLAVVRYVSDTIAVMNLGRIVEVGPAQDVLNRPRHPYTQSLLAAVPHLGHSYRPGSSVTSLTDAEPPDPHRPPPGCHFHPRCPVGPMVNPDRTVCLDVDPRSGIAHRPHQAACHFAES